MKEIITNIIENKEISKGIYKMTMSLPEDFNEQIKAGQFLNIKLDELFLRRPISIFDWSDDSVTIVYKALGQGTEQMVEYPVGKELSVLLPLGNGFDMSKAGEEPLLIGGGVGLPPMYSLAKAMHDQGIKATVVLGFNSDKEIFCMDEFAALGIEPVITTADGSAGIKGFVTDAIKDMNFTYFYTCGPIPMFKAIENTVPAEIDGQYSFEERMGCGFGACMGCSCKTKYGSKRICKEGPVLERGEIVW